jgi:hypothetical protein
VGGKHVKVALRKKQRVVGERKLKYKLLKLKLPLVIYMLLLSAYLIAFVLSLWTLH